MKKLFIFLAFIFCSLTQFAQSPPQKMSYQAVIRDANNNLLVSTQVGMRISILQNNAMGMAQEVYVETQNPTTNINGLVSLEVGGGMMVSGTFSGINWALGSCFIKTETDPTGGSNYSISGMSQLLSVPYALYAGSSGTAGNGDYWELHGNSNTLDDGTFFVGTTNNIPLNFKVNNQKAGRIDQFLFNTFFGYLSGNSNTTGQWNTAVGNLALRDNTIGHDNTAIGDETLTFNTIGNFNTALGEGSLFRNTTGNDNTAIGYSALGSNTIGNQNTAVGNYALFANTTTGNNTAVGFKSLWKNTQGGNNTANGAFSLTSNTTGGNNTAFGFQSMQANIIGTQNTAVGSGALLVSNATYNTAMGANTLYNNTTGNANTGFGTSALFENISGYNNTGIGLNSLRNNKLGYDNTGIGNGSDVSTDNLNNATALGNGAIANASNQVRLGNSKVSSLYFGTGDNLGITTNDAPNMYYDFNTGQIMRSTASVNNSANSWNLLGNAGTIDGTNFIGTTDSTPLSFRVNNQKAGRIDHISNNSFYGYLSGDVITTGANNSAFGMKALNNNSTGHMNTSLGTFSLFSNTIANGNVAIGESALYLNTTGGYNTAVGRAALLNNTTGERNTVIGEGADVAFGSVLNYATAIGSRAFVEQSNSLILGSINGVNGATASVDVGIGTTTPESKLHIKGGSVKIQDGTEGLGKVLTSDAFGLAHWTTVSSTNTTYAVGDSFGGGIVFYVDASGQHGLIAATVDQSTGIQWYNGSYHLTGSTGDGLFAGKMNTTLIVATQIADNYTGNFAAKICADYLETNSTAGDWYLPSKYELNLLYAQKNIVGGFSNANYWSATESDNANAWLQDFTNGTQNNAAKNFTAPRVRAIRSF